MKKLIACISILFVVGILCAEVKVQEMITGYIRPATATSNVTIAAAGAGSRLCLSDVAVVTDTTATFRILDGSTTDYALVIVSSTPHVKNWDIDNLFCSDMNSTLTLKVDAGVFKINYQGVVLNK